VDFETAEKIKMESTLIDERLFDSKGTTKAVAMFQAIDGFLCDLVDEIKKSMTFFEDFFMEDISDAEILLAGGTSRVENLDRFIAKEIGLPVKRIGDASHKLASGCRFAPQFASILGLLAKPPNSTPFHINLLNSIEGMLFKLQEGDYYLTRDGFIPKRKYKRIEKKRTRESIRTRKPPVPEVDIPIPTFVALIKNLPKKVKARFRGEKGYTRGPFSQFEKSNIARQLKYMFVVLGVIFLLSATAHQFLWSPKINRLSRTINTYLSKNAELDSQKAPLINDITGQVYTFRKTDKILWTNKLKTIALALPQKVWISDLEINGGTEKTEGVGQLKRALTLVCHVSSDAADHLFAISQFINNLKRQEVFSKDFTDVKFHSAVRSSDEQNTLDFSLTFPFKRELLIESVETLVK
jgi:hypothetical protein